MSPQTPSSPPSGPDPFDLGRFLTAQDDHRTYAAAVEELRRGAKRSHWMWFVFPQLEGLGRSPTARRYAIGSLEEARAYLDHPVLGARLRECAELVLAAAGDANDADAPDRSAEEILGPVDALKLRSSMTLFARAAEDELLFAGLIERLYRGRFDNVTDDRLSDGATG